MTVYGYSVGKDGITRPVTSKVNDEEYHMSYGSWVLTGQGWPDGNNHKRKPRNRGSSRRKLVRLLALQSNKCFYCGKEATPSNSNIDHVVPISAGGSRKFNNLVASHKDCNQSKADRLPTQDELEKLQQLHKDFKG